MKITGIYNHQTKENQFECLGVEVVENEELLLAGYSPNDETFPNEFLKAYQEKKDLYNTFTKMFLVAYVNKKDGSFHAFSDITSFNVDLYYTQKEDCLYYSTNLKDVLRLSQIERAFNFEAAPYFLENGFILGEETLIKNVYKLKIGHELIFDEKGLRQEVYIAKFENCPFDEAKELLIPTIQECILNLKKDTGDLCIPLSRGFDSNMILHTLHTNDDRLIHTFTIGGERGNNEISSVEEIVKETGNVELHSKVIGHETAEFLPDIIWRLDGCVYESGIFLDYTMSKLASSFGAKYLITGAGSDESQFIHYLDNFRDIVIGKKNSATRMFYHSDPFAFANKVYLKKNSVLLNSFGIDGLYPFKNRRFVEVAHSLEYLQKTHKTYYKQEMAKMLNPKVYEILKTQGGTTTIDAIFTGEELKEIEKKLSLKDFIKTLNRQKTMMQMPKATARIYREDRFKYFINRYILKRTVEENSDLPLRKLYLYIFNELYVSGKYDSYFEQEGIAQPLSEML